MKKGVWSDAEVKALFEFVKEVKAQKKPLKDAFVSHAKKFGRKPDSVRNYYYFELDELSKNPRRAEKLKIDMNSHQKNEIVYFSEAEKNDLKQEIDKLVREGNSVRKACLILSKGDVTEMLRYQNKYRNYLAKNKKESNIIKFTTKKREILTESDIQSLFMGLVRLVKRSAIEELSDKMERERESSNYLLRKTLVDLNRREKEIRQLKEEFAELKLENKKLIENMKAAGDKQSKLSAKLSSYKHKEMSSQE